MARGREHPWWSRYELEGVLSARILNSQNQAMLGIQIKHLRESVTRSPLSHIRGWPATACEGRAAVIRPRAPLVEQVRAVGGAECNDLRQAGYNLARYPYRAPPRKRYMISALTHQGPACLRL